MWNNHKKEKFPSASIIKIPLISKGYTYVKTNALGNIFT